jgi:hypothetical protein
VMKRYALRRADGRSDFECSKYDSARSNKLETNERLDATAAGVRIWSNFDVAHSITVVNCKAAKLLIAI